MDDDALEALGFGTFHAALLLVLGVFLLHRAGTLGALLGGLGTLGGLALFALLWVLSIAAARLTLRRRNMPVASAAALWGGAAGAAFVGVAVVAATLAARGPPTELALLAFLAPGAFLVGALVGAALSMLDRGILRLAVPGRLP